MDSTLIPPSKDRYGSFSSAEQAEYDMMRGGLDEPGFDAISAFDFDSFVSSLQAEDCGALNNEVSRDINFASFSMQETDQNDSSSSVDSTPSTSTRDLDTPTTTPSCLHLILPSGNKNISFSPDIGAFSAYHLSPLSNSIISPHTSLVKGDFPLHESGENALGLLGGLSESALVLSGFRSGDLGHSGGDYEQHAAILDFSSNPVLSPFIDACGNSRLAPENYEEPGYYASLVPQVERIIGNEPKGPAISTSTTVINPESLCVSTSPTPQEPMPQLVRDVTCNERDGRTCSTLSTATKGRPHRGYSGTSPSANRTRLSKISCATTARQGSTILPNRPADECEYGWRVWVFEGCHRIAKWKCRFCEKLVGRRPDLNRHYKTCVVKDKFICGDVLHSDGTTWSGCGQRFSRRDACHRHLKKRFTYGRCLNREPQRDGCENEDDYVKKMVCYDDSILNQKWRAALPASEKNRMVKTALSDIKQDMFW